MEIPQAPNCGSLSCISVPMRCLQVHSLAQCVPLCEPWEAAVAPRPLNQHLQHPLPEAARPSCSAMLSSAVWSSLAFRALSVLPVLPPGS